MNSTSPTSSVKNIAVLCAGLDGVLRGYESHTRRLFDQLHKEQRAGFHFTLYKRSGEKVEGEKILRTPSRRNIFCTLPAKVRGDRLYWESVWFSFAFILHCIYRRKKFHKIVVIEPIVAKMLHRMKKWIPAHPEIVWTHGVSNHPAQNLPMADLYHEVNIENFKATEKYWKENNVTGKQLFLIPHFITEPHSQQKLNRDLIRSALGITTSKVMLSVGAFEDEQKRMGYLMKEIAQLPADWTFLVIGKVADEQLLTVAKKILGHRFVNTTLPLERMNEAYHAADVFSLASLQEGFGIVIIEAMAMGLPVVLHDRELFHWILKSAENCIDMQVKGNFSAFMLKNDSAEWRKAEGEKNLELARKYYFWEAVKEDYYAMYE